MAITSAAYALSSDSKAIEAVDVLGFLDVADATTSPNESDHDHSMLFHDAALTEMEVLSSLEMVAASAEHIDLAQDAATVTKHGKTRISPEEKKRRNRECMRRLRNRRSDLVVAMREEIHSLETQLNRHLGLSNPTTDTDTTVAARGRLLGRLQLDHARMKTTMRRLREENYWLHKQITQKNECFAAVAQLAQAREEACPPIDMDALEEEEINAWIRNVSHFFMPLHVAQAFNIVMDSYRLIQEGIRIIHKARMQVNTVMGWADQRLVDGCWANYTMQKAFPHESTHQLALKTWKMLTDTQEINLLQPKSHEMKVVQRLNEHTLVVARHTYFMAAKFSYCMLYLVFLLEIEGGYVIGMRALDTDTNKMKAFTTKNFIHAKPYHCFHFEDQHKRGGGCVMAFAGRVDCMRENITHHVAMDMLLAMMRWESHCVAPLWCLGN